MYPNNTLPRPRQPPTTSATTTPFLSLALSLALWPPRDRYLLQSLSLSVSPSLCVANSVHSTSGDEWVDFVHHHIPQLLLTTLLPAPHPLVLHSPGERDPHETQTSPRSKPRLLPKRNAMAAVPSVGDWHTRSIVEVYGSGDVETRATARVRALLAAFDARFGVSKAGDDGDVIVARAPGRVNLIGEHIDYEGYGVLPMAIAKDVLVAMRQRRNADMTPARVIVANVDSARYLEASFAAEPTQAVNASQHSWANYFLCAYKGVYEEASTAVDTTIGLEVMVSGDVPQGAGLSSSSAFICASSVALMRTLGLSFERARVAAFTCTCERYVGVLSGGMDQAISIFAERGVAKYVTFDPVRTQDVALPAGVQFVIADSAAISEKAVSATDCYNARVLECRLAAVVLAICAASMSRDAAREKARTLADVETMLGSREAAIAAAEKLLHADVYSADEIVECIGCSLEDFCDGSKVHLDVVEVRHIMSGRLLVLVITFEHTFALHYPIDTEEDT